MTSPEYTEYERLTEGMEFKFSALSETFMQCCENVIFGDEDKELPFICYHYYNDSYFEPKYNRLCVVAERLYHQTDESQFPNLKNGFANLIIYLREPKTRENDKEYKNANIKYWRDMVASDEVLRGNGSFRKYLFSQNL